MVRTLVVIYISSSFPQLVMYMPPSHLAAGLGAPGSTAKETGRAGPDKPCQHTPGAGTRTETTGPRGHRHKLGPLPHRHTRQRGSGQSRRIPELPGPNRRVTNHRHVRRPKGIRQGRQKRGPIPTRLQDLARAADHSGIDAPSQPTPGCAPTEDHNWNGCTKSGKQSHHCAPAASSRAETT